MIDFAPVYERTKTVQEIADGLSVADLRAATTELFDLVYDMIAECDDADVTFQPVDPAAKDDAAASADEVNIAWTLGHVIVHLTASCEESAALAAEAARGVAFHGRSRAETPWERVTTLAQVRQRLAESHRMCLGSLDMWPDSPQLDAATEAWPGGPVIDARGRYLLGLLHADSHLGQIRDVLGQAQAV
ncbi:DinB family protein [Oscillochloris sp. ZM17-4]|uniref:DinB family protein n=1 Tax=Oscillochloris sp. ZM17-4 TaxID=2866714 RepID=UPI001C72C68E|nr:DinB family protein [Oscillochloris sp. ZM17-4]MBX0326560.1 DinB family protein [Oscillochloris sp. ZM17-4]